MMRSALAALSMLTVLPLPTTEWNDKTLRHMLLFFPLPGLLTALLLWGWHSFATWLGLTPFLYGTVAALLPVLFSGGVHMDAVSDTGDALGAHRDRETSLAILSDPRTGAFGVMHVAGLLLLSAGLWTQVCATPVLLPLALGGCVAARALDALSILLYPPARKEGLCALFRGKASRGPAIAGNLLTCALCSVLWLSHSVLWGGILTVLCGLWFWRHYRMCMRRFGGNTGDLAGYLLESIQLLALGIAALGGAML